MAFKHSGSITLNADGLIVCRSPVFGDYDLALGQVRLIGEFTTDNGPLIDDYFLCLAIDHDGWYEISNYAQGIENFKEQLQQQLGTEFAPKLVCSTKFASNVLWPSNLAGEPMFKFEAKPRTGGKKWLPVFENKQSLSDPVSRYLENSEAPSAE
ncbi:MAG: hypothetical protein AB8C95_03945 [Phycisphaeraceae bacterium]